MVRQVPPRTNIIRTQIILMVGLNDLGGDGKLERGSGKGNTQYRLIIVQVDKLVINTNKVGSGTVCSGGKENGLEVDEMNGIWGGNFLTQASKKTCRPKVKTEVTIPRIHRWMRGKWGKKLLRITHMLAQASPVQLIGEMFLRSQGRKKPCLLVKMLGI